MHLVLGAVLDLKNEPREAPGTLKNDAPVEAGAKILLFRGFRPRAQKRAKKEPPGRPKWSPNRPPEPLGRVKSRWEILPEPPRKFTMNFFSAPEASGSDLGAPREAQNKDFMLRSLFFPPPGGSGERFWSHLGSIFACFLERF